MKKITIGRASNNTVVIINSSVSRYHLEVNVKRSKYFIQDLGSTNGTTVNGKRIISETEVSANDDILLGGICLDWGKHIAPYLSIPEKTVKVGRGTACDVIINQPDISMEHLHLIYEKDKVKVLDCNSTNGTFINGKQITSEQVLKPGDRLYAHKTLVDWEEKEDVLADKKKKLGIWPLAAITVAATLLLIALPYIKKTPAIENTASLQELYQDCKQAVFMVYTTNGYDTYQGSGFFVSEDGLAVSNYHVFKGTRQGLETIKTLNGKEYKIDNIVAKSEDFDYIIFKVDLADFEIVDPIPVAECMPQIGEAVFAIGNPEGLESTLSSGIISGYRLNQQLIQTTTEITHGSSGGPLINMNGEVIGITTMGLGDANLNFAISIQQLGLE